MKKPSVLSLRLYNSLISSYLSNSNNRFGSFCSSPLQFQSLRSCSQNSVKNLENPVDKLNRANINCRYKRLIKEAVRAYGPFLDQNPKLSELIKNSKAFGLPQDSIDFSTKITLDPKVKTGMKEITYPGMMYIVVQYETHDSANLDHHLISIGATYDAGLMVESNRQRFFDNRGIVVVTGRAQDKPCLEEDCEALKGNGIVSVQQEYDHDNKLLFTVYTDSINLVRVKRDILSKGFVIEEAYVGLVPKNNTVTLKGIAGLADFVLQLSELTEVDRITTNARLV